MLLQPLKGKPSYCYPLRQIGISVPRFRLPWQYSDHACIEYAFRLILETDPKQTILKIIARKGKRWKILENILTMRAVLFSRIAYQKYAKRHSKIAKTYPYAEDENRNDYIETTTSYCPYCGRKDVKVEDWS